VSPPSIAWMSFFRTCTTMPLARTEVLHQTAALLVERIEALVERSLQRRAH